MISSTHSLPKDRDALIVLNAISGLGNRRILELLDHFAPSAILDAARSGALHEIGLSEQVIFNIVNFDAGQLLEAEYGRARALGARMVTILDGDYPPRLKQIADAPIVLYFSGNIPERMEIAFAIVGSRDPSMYGLQMAGQFARQLTELGMPIVSGLARGIDTAAHEGCLKAGGGTVGVLGCGLDVAYPPQNKGLIRKICETGCVISEFPFGTKPFAYNFPRRNRIVSGLSLGVLVVEARFKSGALITADFALEQGREVFAMPGRADSLLSDGPHEMIRQGAKLVLCVEDILQELPVKILRCDDAAQEENISAKGLAGDEQKICNILQEETMSLEDLQGRMGVSSSTLMRPLLSLQIKKMIREVPGKIYELMHRRE